MLCFSIQSTSNEVSIKLSRKELSFLSFDTHTRASIQGQMLGYKFVVSLFDSLLLFLRDDDDEMKRKKN
jgi:hypothetical protein